MIVLGIHGYTHDSSAALSVDGQLHAFAEEERFTRKKGESGFPFHSIRHCLKEACVLPSEIDRVVVPFRPRKGAWTRIKYLLGNPAQFLQNGYNLSMKGRNLLAIRKPLNTLQVTAPVLYKDHYLCHAMTVFLSSPFDEASVLVMDGVAERWSGALYRASRSPEIAMECMGRIPFPHSLGLFYAAVTKHLGFDHNRDEGRVMAMAALGDDRFIRSMRDVFEVKDGQFYLNQKLFDFHGKSPLRV